MSDLKKRSVDDLEKDIADKREALRSFRFGASGSRSRNVREGRQIKRDIARILTELRARKSPVAAKSKVK